MSKYLILGTGEMGLQLAQLIFSFNQNSEIILFSETGKDINQKSKKLMSDLFKLSRMGKFKYKLEDHDYERISFVTNLDNIEKPDFIFECLREDKKKKIKFLEICSEKFSDSIIATNTSSLSINDLSKYLNTSERFFGCHFFNPVLKTRFAEIILNHKSNLDNLTKLKIELSLYLKDFVITSDNPGFIVNKVLISLIESGLELHIKEGISIKEIDKSLKIGANFISGPFEIADRIGLDVVAEIMKNIKRTTYIKFLNTKIMSNELGRKTGKGFYTY